jgi:hypothetical protein
MSTIINFLGAAVPLTKTFCLEKNGSLTKDAYPLVSNVTSYEEEVSKPLDLYNAIKRHADQGHCMLKGLLTRPLVQESRRGTTKTNDKTEVICLDFDRHECVDLDEELERVGLGDITYVLQWSASQGTPGTEGTISCHVFMLLDGEVPAPDLKAWLMGINLNHFRDTVRLSRSKTVLSWPLDITTCQNDKLLYIATPIFKNMKDPLKARISLVPKKLARLPVERIGTTNINTLKVAERKLLNELRKLEDLPARTAKTSWVGTCEIQNKPDVATVTDIREGDDFIRLNINGGDSWAYWHAKDNFELIHDFKSDTWYKTKEFLPEYYSELVEQRNSLASTPTDDGDLILAFRDFKTAEYYNGLWNPANNKLELYRAKNETQLDHWMRSHGRVIGDYIPVWEMVYNPLEDWVVDAEQHRINTFKPSSYFYLEPKADAKFPAIEYLIKHLLGCSSQDEALYQHFINWLAVVFQRKGTSNHPITSWVIHGTEGTGKGSFFSKVVTPLFGFENVFAAGVSNIEEGFNGWMQNKLFIMIEEIDVDDFKDKGRVSAKLKVYITEPKIPFRQMRQTAVFMETYASFLFASNKKQPVQIPENDRRYNCGNYQRDMLKYPGDDAIEAELEAFAQFLLAHKADAEAANKVLQTEARERIQKLGVTSIDETCRHIIEGDFDALWMSMPDERLLNESGIQNKHTQDAQAYSVLMKRLLLDVVNEPRNALTRDEMQLILQYNVGNMPEKPNKFTSLLRHHNIETKQGRRNGQKTYIFDVEWKISDELRAELLGTPTKSKIRKIK